MSEGNKRNHTIHFYSHMSLPIVFIYTQETYRVYTVSVHSKSHSNQSA